jgi:metal-responsive CopG/Arc/MetJ family transcriptional regulator
MKSSSKSADDDEATVDGDTIRFKITLPAFTVFELDDLVKIYAPTRAQVAAHAVEQWLHDNEEKIALRKARYADFLKSRSQGPREKS